MKKLINFMPMLFVFSGLWLVLSGGNQERFIEEVSKMDSVQMVKEQALNEMGIPLNLQVNKQIREIFQDSHGNVWFGTGDFGIVQLSEQNRENQRRAWPKKEDGGIIGLSGDRMKHFTKDEGLAGLNITAIMEDNSGNLWLATNEGLSRYDGNSFKNYSTADGLNSNSVWSIYQDRKGTIWAGTYEGLSRFDGERFQTVPMPFEKFQEANTGCSNRMIWAITEDKEGDLWIGTDSHGLFKYDRQNFYHFSETEGFNARTILSIQVDSGGDIWFGTLKGGLIRYNGQSFNRIMDKKLSEVNMVWTIHEDNSGNIWFSSQKQGLFRYDGNNITTYNEINGMKNPRVLSILEDRQGRMWIGTAMGLYTLHKDNFIDLSGFKGGC